MIADYLLLSAGKAGLRATKSRLSHITRYINHRDPSLTVAAADEAFANAFRTWMAGQDASRKKGEPRPYSLSMIEGSLVQLAAAINATPGQKAGFKPEQMAAVANSPKYRADVPTIAAMFNYCLRPDDASVRHWRNPDLINAKLLELRIAERANLLRYLRAAVATWARPDALYDLTDRQWFSEARVLDLNPPNRRQTRKFRPKIPVARQFAPHLNQLDGSWLPVSSIRAAWDRMCSILDLPRDGEAGEKLIRRSMSTQGRRMLGEESWIQGRMMLGHVKFETSDIYALPDPANLGRALAVTEQIIDEIEVLSPSAFSIIPSSADLRRS